MHQFLPEATKFVWDPASVSTSQSPDADEIQKMIQKLALAAYRINAAFLDIHKRIYLSLQTHFHDKSPLWEEWSKVRPEIIAQCVNGSDNSAQGLELKFSKIVEVIMKEIDLPGDETNEVEIASPLRCMGSNAWGDNHPWLKALQNVEKNTAWGSNITRALIRYVLNVHVEADREWGTSLTEEQLLAKCAPRSDKVFSVKVSSAGADVMMIWTAFLLASAVVCIPELKEVVQVHPEFSEKSRNALMVR